MSHELAGSLQKRTKELTDLKELVYNSVMQVNSCMEKASDLIKTQDPKNAKEALKFLKTANDTVMYLKGFAQ